MKDKAMTEIAEKINKYEKIYVHSGSFHSDDLLSVAFMKMLNPKINYERIDYITPEILNKAKEGKALICDIGNVYDKENNLFDHHQENNDNLIASNPSWDKNKHKTYYYSAFGLLWENFKDYYCYTTNKNEKFKEMFTDIIVRQIDACDNGVKIPDGIKLFKTSFPQIVKAIFMPTSIDKLFQKENKLYNEAFKTALGYGEKFLSTHVANINKICNSLHAVSIEIPRSITIINITPTKTFLVFVFILLLSFD